MIADINQAVRLYKKTKDERDLKVVVKMLEKYAHHEVNRKEDWIEAKSDLNYVIYKAVTKYDETKNIKFNTFFWHCYHNHIIRNYVAKQTIKRGQGAKEISLNKKVFNEVDGEEFSYYIPDKSKDLEQQEFHAAFNQVLSKIESKKDAFIVWQLYRGFTVPEIAVHFGVSRSSLYRRVQNMRDKPYGKEMYALLKDCIAEKTS
jgi:RNA polymerase sigma factor (sigma-70 family)